MRLFFRKQMSLQLFTTVFPNVFPRALEAFSFYRQVLRVLCSETFAQRLLLKASNHRTIVDIGLEWSMVEQLFRPFTWFTWFTWFRDVQGCSGGPVQCSVAQEPHFTLLESFLFVFLVCFLQVLISHSKSNLHILHLRRVTCHSTWLRPRDQHSLHSRHFWIFLNVSNSTHLFRTPNIKTLHVKASYYIILSFIFLHILLRTKKCLRVALQLFWFFALVAARQADVQDVSWQDTWGGWNHSTVTRYHKVKSRRRTSQSGHSCFSDSMNRSKKQASLLSFVSARKCPGEHQANRGNRLTRLVTREVKSSLSSQAFLQWSWTWL